MNNYTLQFLNNSNRIRTFVVETNFEIDSSIESLSIDSKEIKDIVKKVNKHFSNNEQVQTPICIWDQNKERLINII